VRSNVAVSAEKKRCKLVGSARGALEMDLASEEDNMVEILRKQEGKRATKLPLSDDTTKNERKCRPILPSDSTGCRPERSSVCRATPKKAAGAVEREATHYCTQYITFLDAATHYHWSSLFY
jgi:hypothetical protein